MEFPDDIQELKNLLALILGRVSQLETENAALKVENAELRRRLDLNSHNSHQPPSSDGFSKKPALPKESGKKTGGQVGHPGKTLRAVAEPDEIVLHHARQCGRCQRAFSLADVEQVVEKRQVFDIPRPALEVVEHQLGEITCCGEKQYGEFPAEVSNNVQYGTRIKALSVLLNTDYRLPLEKIEHLFFDLYACSFNQSTALRSNQECYEKLEPIEQRIKEEIVSSQIAHFDETGMRVESKLHWFHVASTRLFSYLFVDKKRGKEALNGEKSLIKHFKNWAVHDCWESYFKFEDCRHVLCNAHLLRELENLKEQGSNWGAQMQEFLFQLYEASEKGSKELGNREEWEQRYRRICREAELEEPLAEKSSRGKPKNSVGRNLLNRLKKHETGVLEFAFTECVPFTNNQAERDLRCVKIKQKVSNSFRRFKGAEHYARIQGFVSSVRKHKMNVFQEIVNVLSKKNIFFQMAK